MGHAMLTPTTSKEVYGAGTVTGKDGWLGRSQGGAPPLSHVEGLEDLIRGGYGLARVENGVWETDRWVGRSISFPTPFGIN